ncbi:hypothetical protein OHA86_00795 [Streptomyces sp. NBC_01477]|nr:hypothetical protein [Streptomyces sp. NBC_01477]
MTVTDGHPRRRCACRCQTELEQRGRQAVCEPGQTWFVELDAVALRAGARVDIALVDGDIKALRAQTVGEREAAQAGTDNDHTIRIVHSPLPSFTMTKEAPAFLWKEPTPHGAPLRNTIHERVFRAFHLALITLARPRPPWLPVMRV